MKKRNVLFNIFLKIRKSVYLTLAGIDKFLSRKNMLTVLCYHDISESDWIFSTSFQQFSKQIEYLHSHYKFITLKDLELYIVKKNQIKEPSIILTFDDGYKSNLKVKNILRSLNIKPALFVLSDSIKIAKMALGNDKELLNTEQILELMNNEWEIGVHGATHRKLSEVSQKELEYEIVESKSILESKLGVKLKYFSYPKGRYNERVLKQVKAANYKLALTMDDGIIATNTNRFKIPRIGINGTHTFSEFKAAFSPSVILFRKLVKKIIGDHI